VAAVPRLFSTLLIILATSVLFLAHAQTKPAAINADHLSPLERGIFQEINLARTRPAEYAGYLEKLKPYFKGKMYQPPGQPALVTEEGTSALEEAISALRGTSPLPPYAISKGMCMGALEHVRDQGPKGLMGHKGSDGSLCEERVGRYGAWQEAIGENLSYGKESARERVLTLLIDDGVANRGHRNRILNRDYKVVGVSCGDHSQLGTMCVITFAGSFAEKLTASAPASINAPAGAKTSAAKPSATQPAANKAAPRKF
jgi:uncharacterized protein YkwD